MSEIKISCTARQQIETICDQCNNDPGELIHILHEVQHAVGFLPEDVQRVIAVKLRIPPSKVFGVVSFYTFFTMTPKGRNPISGCMGTARCFRGSEKICVEPKRCLNH